MSFDFFAHTKPGSDEACEAAVVNQDVTVDGLSFIDCEVCGYHEEFPTVEPLEDSE